MKTGKKKNIEGMMMRRRRRGMFIRTMMMMMMTMKRKKRTKNKSNNNTLSHIQNKNSIINTRYKSRNRSIKSETNKV